MLVGDQVVCPLHGFRFQGETGECDHGNVCPVGTYAVEVVNGTVVLVVGRE